MTDEGGAPRIGRARPIEGEAHGGGIAQPGAGSARKGRIVVGHRPAPNAHRRYRAGDEGLRLRLAVHRPRAQFDGPRHGGTDLGRGARGRHSADRPCAGAAILDGDASARRRRDRHRHAACRYARGGARHRGGVALPAAGASLGRGRAAAFQLRADEHRRDLRGDERGVARHRADRNAARGRECGSDCCRARHRLPLDRHQRSGDGTRCPRRLQRRAHRRRLSHRHRRVPRKRQMGRARRHQRRGADPPLCRDGRAHGAWRQRSRLPDERRQRAREGAFFRVSNSVRCCREFFFSVPSTHLSQRRYRYPPDARSTMRCAASC